MSVFLIMLFCAGCYLVRIVWSGAYAGPREKNKHRLSIVGAAGAALLAAAIVFAQTRLAGRQAEVNSADGGAVVVFLASISIMVAVAGVTIAAGAVSRWRSGRDEE
ncbi:MAG: hypothetical protein ACM3X4_04835 [Ignavibacteriales bacterium]